MRRKQSNAAKDPDLDGGRGAIYAADCKVLAKIIPGFPILTGFKLSFVDVVVPHQLTNSYYIYNVSYLYINITYNMFDITHYHNISHYHNILSLLLFTQVISRATFLEFTIKIR